MREPDLLQRLPKHVVTFHNMASTYPGLTVGPEQIRAVAARLGAKAIWD